MVPAGPSGIEIRLGGLIIGDIDLRVCGHCRLAVVEHIRIEPAYRRRGLATRAVHAVLAGHPGYRWATSPIDDNPGARSFWDSLDWPGTPGTGELCPHMREADQRTL